MAEEFASGVNWFYSCIASVWTFLTSVGFIGYCAIGLLVVRRVCKLVAKVLHK